MSGRPPRPPMPGDLVAVRLRGTASVLFGVVDPERDPGTGFRLRFPAELRGFSFMGPGPIAGQAQLTTVPYLFWLALPSMDVGEDEIGSCLVLRDDDLDSRFEYARNVLADYRAAVARWAPGVVRDASRLIEVPRR